MRYQPPKSHRAHAREMRKDATRAENLLWQALRRSQLEGLSFRRQYPLDGYILDFVCFRPKLIVEVDGAQHAEPDRDVRRDAHFRDCGFVVLRFWNDDVIRNIDGVCREILAAAGRTDPQLRPE
jgi:very-short-patch-repair endonuclease